MRQLQQLKRQLLSKLRKLVLPDNPLDAIIHRLGGPEKVAEMTGRKGRLVRDAVGETVYRKRSVSLGVAMEKVNLEERAAFQEGRKYVAIISEAARHVT